MNLLLCDLAKLLRYAVQFYTILLFVYAIVSWFPDLRRGRWVYYLASVIEPVLNPIRRIIPPIGGLDLAFLVLLLVLQLVVMRGLFSLEVNACIQIF
ncbi:MAG TPA: YggT family protein [Candidatus Cybelea sp.]|nr:YggT family protein [Candidatus Cybelea sp.]